MHSSVSFKPVVRARVLAAVFSWATGVTTLHLFKLLQHLTIIRASVRIPPPDVVVRLCLKPGLEMCMMGWNDTKAQPGQVHMSLLLYAAFGEGNDYECNGSFSQRASFFSSSSRFVTYCWLVYLGLDGDRRRSGLNGLHLGVWTCVFDGEGLRVDAARLS